MQMEKMDQLLAIGSIITLKDGERSLMIMGRFHRNLEDGNIYDYAACLYPDGYQGGNTYFLCNHEHIEQILYQGYQNEEEMIYRQLIKEKLTHLETSES